MMNTPRKGRPPLPGGAVRVNLTLDRRTIERARALGDGNLSAGIRKAVNGPGRDRAPAP